MKAMTSISITVEAAHGGSSSTPPSQTLELGRSSKNPISLEQEDFRFRSLPEEHIDKVRKFSSEGKVPKVGMEFESEQEAYDFYNEYAGVVGFGIRKEWARKKGGICTLRKFSCTHAGVPRYDRRRSHVRNPRPITKFDCKAEMVIKLQPNGKYLILRVNEAHTHQVAPTKSFMFRSRKKLNATQATKKVTADSVGETTKETCDFMDAQSNESEDTSFQKVDYIHYLHSRRMHSMEFGEAGAILQHFQTMQTEDPGSVYAIQLDKDEKIANIFWADSTMVLDFAAFGDVVSFDTTYKVNNLDRPFVPFVGVNHHKQTVVFGATLMYDETVESFEWVFTTFFKAMAGKEPRTILTDHDKAIAEAISKVFPNTSHRICVWHVYQNATKHLSLLFSGSTSFNSDFSRCLFDYEDEIDFLNAWGCLLDKYRICDNVWLRQLFDEREKWALAYGRQTFCADMKTTQRSESVNSLVKKYLSRKLELLQFFEQFDRLVEDRRNAELEADFKMTQSMPNLALNVPILKAARSMYTPEIFKLFQEEYAMGMGCVYSIIEQVGSLVTYKVRHVEKNHEYTVNYDLNDQRVFCACQKFEFSGILCGHALRIIDVACLQAVPDRYFLKRWSKDAKDDILPITRLNATSEEKQKFSQRYKELMQAGIKFFTLCAENEDSKAMGLKMMNEAHATISNILKQSQIRDSTVSRKSSKNKEQSQHQVFPTGLLEGNQNKD